VCGDYGAMAFFILVIHLAGDNAGKQHSRCNALRAQTCRETETRTVCQRAYHAPTSRHRVADTVTIPFANPDLVSTVNRVYLSPLLISEDLIYGPKRYVARQNMGRGIADIDSSTSVSCRLEGRHRNRIPCVYLNPPHPTALQPHCSRLLFGMEVISHFSNTLVPCDRAALKMSNCTGLGWPPETRNSDMLCIYLRPSSSIYVGAGKRRKKPRRPVFDCRLRQFDKRGEPAIVVDSLERRTDARTIVGQLRIPVHWNILG
jgi:hypothetical protein